MRTARSATVGPGAAADRPGQCPRQHRCRHHADIDGLGNDFVGAYNAFLGLEVGLGNLALGIEGKYVSTESVKSFGELEGTQVAVSLSVPF